MEPKNDLEAKRAEVKEKLLADLEDVAVDHPLVRAIKINGHSYTAKEMIILIKKGEKDGLDYLDSVWKE